MDGLRPLGRLVLTGVALGAFAIAVALPAVTTTASTATFAGVTGPEDAEDAELIRSVQERLAEIGLYTGAVDGRMSLELDEAVRAAQRGMGLREDGRITPEFLARLEGITEQAAALRQRLDEARERQSGEARRLLASSSATADLLSDRAPAWNLMASVACTDRVDVACTIAPALGAARVLDDADRRDWILAGLARALTRAGRANDARTLIKGIADPRSILGALREMSEAHAEAGNEAAARVAADLIPDGELRAQALIAAARALMDAGDAEGAMRLLAPALEQSLAPSAGSVASLAESARVAAGAGDITGAEALVARAMSYTGSIGPQHDRDLALGQVAEAQACMGAIDAATLTVQGIGDVWRRAPLLAVLAEAAAGLKRWDIALELAHRINEPRYRSVAEAKIASFYGLSGYKARGLKALDAARVSARAVSRGFARDFAMAAIAMAALDLDGTASFLPLAAEVPDARLRSEVLMAGAQRTRAEGDGAGADRLLALAHEATLSISDPVERSAALARLALGGTMAPSWPAIVADAAAIEDPWQRARALVALADIASAATGR